MDSDFIYVDDLGQVGAGSVVDFIPRNKKILIPRPPNTTDADYIFTHDVSGDSLYNPDNPSMSAFNGDRLICKGNLLPSQITPQKVCIVFIAPTCERLAKQIEIKNDKVYLKSLNPNYPVRFYSVHDVEVKGIVIAVTHYW
jgi:SOS-response transcriptional repressor LexA